MMKHLSVIIATLLVLALLLTGLPSVLFAAGSGGPLGTGLKEPTAAQKQWINDNFPVVRNVRLNDIAFERINTERTQKGLPQLSKSMLNTAPLGSELVTGSDVQSGLSSAVAAILPGAVDNSASPAFPPIRSQGSLGSCASWATTYYQFTYETNLARGRTASNGDNNMIFSPKWTYNMINGGSNSGSYFSDNYALEMRNGAATWAQFPYDSNYLAWDTNPADWRTALNYRASSQGQLYNSNVDTLISDIKTQLANGHVLVIGTYVYSWVQGTINNDPSTAVDDSFAGQKVATYVSNTNSGGHGMTVVGYNDNLWVDLNGNSLIDNGEKGVFKIANSWGTSDWNAGYRWVTYDSLRAASTVPATAIWPTTNRSSSGIFWNGNIFTLTVNPSYTPTLVAQVTVNQTRRNELVMSLGSGSTSASQPTTTWTPGALKNQGGAYAFDGTAVNCDGTFYLDFTDLAAGSSGTTRWFVGMSDGVLSNVSTLKSYQLYRVTSDGDVLVASAANLPVSADAVKVYSYVDYALNSFNQPPVPSLKATPVSGISPLTVAFDASASTDPDGSVAAYAWKFGDGATGTGAAVSHTYSTTSITQVFSASLTVTDDKGASATSSINITVNNPNIAPVASFTVTPLSGNSPLSVSFDASASCDPDGSIAGYSWNFGDGTSASGATVTHVYTTGSASQVFTARLTVTDNRGTTAAASANITVINPNINAPSKLAAKYSRQRVTLTWTDNSIIESGFYIERAAADGVYGVVGQTGSNVRTFTQTVSPGTYKYRVRAYNQTTISAYSNEVSISVR
jgi:PKD repeat protein/C1A family cysteine protease